MTVDTRPASSEAEQAENGQAKIENPKSADVKTAEEAKKTPEAKRLEIEQERATIKKKLEDGLKVLKEFLDSKEAKDLDPVTKARMSSALRTSEAAAAGAFGKNKDTYTVELQNKEGRVTDGREEGVPIEGLNEALAFIKTKQGEKRQPLAEQKEQIAKSKFAQGNLDLFNAKQDANGRDEKEVWHEIHVDNTKKLGRDDKFLKEVMELFHEWEKADKKKGRDYTEDEKRKQWGEALRQVVEKNIKKGQSIDEAKVDLALQEILDNEQFLEKIIDTLDKSSKNYFEAHYGKAQGAGMDEAESQTQHPYTEREADFISKGPELKKVLLAQYQTELAKLQKGGKKYADLPEMDQNYELAKLVLRDRKLLELPPLPEVQSLESAQAEAPEPVAPERRKIQIVDITEVAKRMAWTKAEEQLKQKMDKAGFFKRLAFSMTENYYRIKFYQDALKEIQSDNNLLKAIEGRLAGNRKAQKGDYYEILDKIAQQFEEELGNARKEMGDTVTDPNLAAASADLFYRHAQGKWNDLGPEFQKPGLTERDKVELYVKLKIAPLLPAGAKWGDNLESKDAPKGWKEKFKARLTPSKSSEKKPLLLASNFFKLAEDYKKYIEEKFQELNFENPEQAAAIKEHLSGVMNLDVQLAAKARDLANNKPKGILGVYETLVDWSENNRVLNKIVTNPFVMGIAGGAAGVVAGRGLAKVALVSGLVGLGVAAPVFAPLVAGGALGGMYRYFKRSKDVKYDIAQEHRHEILGGKASGILAEGDFRYTTMSFNEALEFLRGLKGKESAALSQPDREKLARILAMRQRELDPKNKADLFYLTQEQGERFGTTENLKTDLDSLIKAISAQEGFVDVGLVGGELKVVGEEIAAKEANQEHFRKSEARKSAIKGAAWGIAGGLLAQEAVYGGGRLLGIEYFKHHATALDYLIDKGKERLIIGGVPLAHAGSYDTLAHAAGGGQAAETFATIKHPVSGEDFLKGKFHIEALKHADWHDEPGSHGFKNLLFEGKQQQLLIDYKNGQASVDVRGMLRHLVKNIHENSVTNWDKSTDSKLPHIMAELKKALSGGNLHEHMAVRIFPTNGHEGFVLGNIDKDGLLHLPKDVQDAIIDSHGKLLAKHMEIGFLDHNNGYHTFGTATGSGRLGEVIVEQQVPAPGAPPAEELPPQAAQMQYDPAMPLVPWERKLYRRYFKEQGKTAEDKAGKPPKEPKGTAEKAAEQKREPEVKRLNVESMSKEQRAKVVKDALALADKEPPKNDTPEQQLQRLLLLDAALRITDKDDEKTKLSAAFKQETGTAWNESLLTNEKVTELQAAIKEDKAAGKAAGRTSGETGGGGGGTGKAPEAGKTGAELPKEANEKFVKEALAATRLSKADRTRVENVAKYDAGIRAAILLKDKGSENKLKAVFKEATGEDWSEKFDLKNYASGLKRKESSGEVGDKDKAAKAEYGRKLQEAINTIDSLSKSNADGKPRALVDESIKDAAARSKQAKVDAAEMIRGAREGDFRKVFTIIKPKLEGQRNPDKRRQIVELVKLLASLSPQAEAAQKQVLPDLVSEPEQAKTPAEATPVAAKSPAEKPAQPEAEKLPRRAEDIKKDLDRHFETMRQAGLFGNKIDQISIENLVARRSYDAAAEALNDKVRGRRAGDTKFELVKKAVALIEELEEAQKRKS